MEKLPDFTPIVEKIFSLTAAVRRLRSGFDFSRADSRVRRDREFIQYWKSIEAANNEQLHGTKSRPRS